MADAEGLATRPDGELRGISTDRDIARRDLRADLQHALSIWGRLAVCGAALAAQIALFVIAIVSFAEWSPYLLGAQEVIALVVVVWILNSRMHTVYKLAWVVPILLAPVLGSAFYLIFGRADSSRGPLRRAQEARERAGLALALVPSDGEDEPEAAEWERQWRYLENAGGWRLHGGTETSYYALGETAFEAMLADGERAERFIFCEFFIVAEGEMFERLFDVLARKARAGLDVRLLYDDLGSLMRLPRRLRERCEEAGIRVCAVNRLGFGLSLRLNNRDHRKLMIVDGSIAWTGGLNVGDEYINLDQRLGHWKDTQLRLAGPGAWPMTVMFLGLWELQTRETVVYPEFVPPLGGLTGGPDAALGSGAAQGLVLPFDDSPFDRVPVGADAYRNLMAASRRSVDIFTPYLIIEDLLIDDLVRVATSGVRVRIVTPGVPDKRLVYEVTRANYLSLLQAGVEIYEYTPGFLHAKHMIIDGRLAVVGTINFDYRSFYLHLENAVWMAHTSVLPELVADFEATVAVSERVTIARELALPAWRRGLRGVLRVFAPLM